MVTIDDVRRLALSLPRTTEGLVRDSVRFRVGRLVYVAFSPDERVMEFAYPKQEREALVASDPTKFQLPQHASDLRYNWVGARLAALDDDEMRELVVDAWRMCVPKKLHGYPDSVDARGDGDAPVSMERETRASVRPHQGRPGRAR